MGFRLISALAVVAVAIASAQFASAASERTLSLHNLHTGETVTAVYKRDGRYVQSGIDQLNYILRDWRRDEPTRMDPRLFDLAWEIYQQTGSSQPINIISGYRSPATNDMLRSRSNGVAQNSQHTVGKAMDIQFPDVSLETLRNVALRMQIGGVGYYPSSGSPFVHIDTGSVRHWPRLSRSQLASVFPDGHSLHVPSDGTPLPGYAEAQRAYEQRGDQVVALYGAPSDGGQERRLAALFDRNDDAPAADPLPAIEQPEPIAVADVTIVSSPPTPRAEIPGIAITDPAAAALAFAPATTPDRDPLAILTEPAGSPEPTPEALAAVAEAEATPSPVAAAPPIERRWFDPLARLSAPIVNADTIAAMTRAGTLRQPGAVRLSAPFVGASPEFLIKPERVVAGGFDNSGIMPNTTGFSGALRTVATIDLIRLTVAAR